MLIVFTSGHGGLFAGSRQSCVDTSAAFPGKPLSSCHRATRGFGSVLLHPETTVIKLHYQMQVPGKYPQRFVSAIWCQKCQWKVHDRYFRDGYHTDPTVFRWCYRSKGEKALFYPGYVKTLFSATKSPFKSTNINATKTDSPAFIIPTESDCGQIFCTARMDFNTLQSQLGPAVYLHKGKINQILIWILYSMPFTFFLLLVTLNPLEQMKSREWAGGKYEPSGFGLNSEVNLTGSKKEVLFRGTTLFLPLS